MSNKTDISTSSALLAYSRKIVDLLPLWHLCSTRSPTAWDSKTMSALRPEVHLRCKGCDSQFEQPLSKAKTTEKSRACVGPRWCKAATEVTNASPPVEM